MAEEDKLDDRLDAVRASSDWARSKLSCVPTPEETLFVPCGPSAVVLDRSLGSVLSPIKFLMAVGNDPSVVTPARLQAIADSTPVCRAGWEVFWLDFERILLFLNEQHRLVAFFLHGRDFALEFTRMEF